MEYDLLTLGVLLRIYLDGGVKSRRRFCAMYDISEWKLRSILNTLEIDGYINWGMVIKTDLFTSQKPSQNPSQKPSQLTKRKNNKLQEDDIPKTIPKTIPKNVPKNVIEIDYEGLKEYFNRMVEGTSIPRIDKIAERRRDAVRARAKVYGKNAIAEVIKKAAASDFLSGRRNEWHATFDWLFGAKNFVKVIEGNYDGESRRFGSSGIESRLSDVARYINEVESQG